jgi:dTDP-4-dehydrorhamnose reductase
MKVAIVGAGGLVGTELARQFSTEAQVLILTHSKLDITDRETVRNVMLAEAPDLVINCAVLGVDACELAPSSAWDVNVTGAENLAKAVADIDADFVQMSSNFVFSGKRNDDSFYTVEDVPEPINIYGQTKLAGECAVRAAARRCFIVRTSWVFGLGKANFFSAVPRFLYAAKTVRAITDVWASATYVRDLVSRIIEILSRGSYMTYHVVNSGLCSYHDFALETARIMDISNSASKELIEPTKASSLRLIAKRPRYTPMRCIVSEEIGVAPLRDWRAALGEYVRDDCRLALT